MSSAGPRLSPGEYVVLVEQAPIMIWRSGLNGLCDYFNQRWLDFTGRTLAQECGIGWAEGVHPEDLPRCVDYYLDHFNRRLAFEMEYRLRRSDGAWRWIFDRGTPYFDQDGVFTGFIGSCVDVTDRVEAQAALLENRNAQIRTLQGLLPLCIFCKKVKNEQDSWDALEHYVREHSEADFSHGLCPDCYPAYIDRIQAELPGTPVR